MKTQTLLLLISIVFGVNAVTAKLVMTRGDKLLTTYDERMAAHERRRIMACEITIDTLEIELREARAELKMFQAYLKHKLPATPEDVEVGRRMMGQWQPLKDQDPMRCKIVQEAHQSAEEDR